MPHTLLPGDKVPDLELKLLSGETWRLSEQNPENFIMLDFYRGVHCGRCKLHLLDLNSKAARFVERGVQCVAVSMDDFERAQKAQQVWQLNDLGLTYGLTEEQARSFGLFLTDSINESEPHRFNEPAILLIHPGSLELYSAMYGSNPFQRIHGADILEALDTILARHYPARGTVI